MIGDVRVVTARTSGYAAALSLVEEKTKNIRTNAINNYCKNILLYKGAKAQGKKLERN